MHIVYPGVYTYCTIIIMVNREVVAWTNISKILLVHGLWADNRKQGGEWGALAGLGLPGAFQYILFR